MSTLIALGTLVMHSICQPVSSLNTRLSLNTQFHKEAIYISFLDDETGNHESDEKTIDIEELIPFLERELERILRRHEPELT